MRTGGSLVLAAFLLALLPCAGCGSKAAATRVMIPVPVKGTVTYKGKPFTQGQITFEPEDAGREAHGAIQPVGTYVLTTFKEGDGAVAGLHRIGVTASGKPTLPVRYRTPSSSRVQVEVSKGKTDYPIDLR